VRQTKTGRQATTIVVRAVNTTDATLTPHFASRTGQGASAWWRPISGPASLPSHASATYVVRAPGGFRGLPEGRHTRIYLIAVTGTPMTITTTRIPLANPPVPTR
jgi:hypothetical protein